jgi:hypothetical protein
MIQARVFFSKKNEDRDLTTLKDRSKVSQKPSPNDRRSFKSVLQKWLPKKKPNPPSNSTNGSSKAPKKERGEGVLAERLAELAGECLLPSKPTHPYSIYCGQRFAGSCSPRSRVRAVWATHILGHRNRIPVIPFIGIWRSHSRYRLSIMFARLPYLLVGANASIRTIFYLCH